ncbi:MAG TPA: VWA domain-containing protein [Terriglobales bacterium]|nr:VWA domain-containing protein [Terriglobales bacterium]
MIEAGPCLWRILKTWLYVLSAFLTVLILGCVAYGQMEDPVHIVPRADTHPHAAADATGPLDVGLRPEHRSGRLRVDVDLVLVPVIVTDTFNRPVTGLSKDSFELLDDGQKQNIHFFSLEDGPVSVALVLDISNSMVNRVAVEREALAKFFQNANPDDEYFAIGVSTSPVLLADSTQSIGDIQAQLTLLQPSGYTALLDSIYFALNKLHSARYPRKVILIISDGGENDSRFKFREIKSLAEESDVTVYAIRPVDAIPMFRTIEEKWGNRLLSGITDATGGRTVSLSYNDNIPGAAAAISAELRNQYVLGYHPTEKSNAGRPHKIKVRMTKEHDSSALHLQYRKQYSTR